MVPAWGADEPGCPKLARRPLGGQALPPGVPGGDHGSSRHTCAQLLEQRPGCSKRLCHCTARPPAPARPCQFSWAGSKLRSVCRGTPQPGLHLLVICEVGHLSFTGGSARLRSRGRLHPQPTAAVPGAIPSSCHQAGAGGGGQREKGTSSPPRGLWTCTTARHFRTPEATQRLDQEGEGQGLGVGRPGRASGEATGQGEGCLGSSVVIFCAHKLLERSRGSCWAGHPGTDFRWTPWPCWERGQATAPSVQASSVFTM